MIVDQAVYRQGRRQECRDLSDALAELRAEGAPDEDFVWVGLQDPTPQEFDFVVAELGLHPLAVEDVLAGNERAKVEVYDDTIFAVVKTLNYLESTSDIETAEIMAVIGHQVAVTLLRGDVAPLHHVRQRLEAHEQELLREGPVAVLHGLIDKVVDSYQEIDEEVARDLVEIEMDVFGDGRQVDSTTIYRLKREVLEFRRAAQPLRPALHQLVDEDGIVGSKELRLQFRDVSDHLSAVLADIESFDALLSDVLNTHLSQIAVQQNSDMRKISAWAAMITVPTLVAGIYGMNFDHMPELHWLLGYPLALLLMVAVVLGLHRTFKRSGWL